ncbi:hypothetical protein SAMN02745823_02357 [Sporobacter termitidis DSM 10068]|uniref:Uncharacterized protein n=1 Tax=Sporobacter termitidis DSM 10068 TaxID=1123282 RepID=A0A1M5YC17_9FIRM|nr:hypothetical protein [Sporobacter termitidis]SHI09522.1 hypothetical protein SAMN02745823_02357 [Sporobacter termitidis DSM 10068]
MSISKYFALAGMVNSEDVAIDPADAHVRSVRMDGSFYKGCMFGEVCWIVKPFSRDDFFRHRSDELLVFIGSDMDDPENLNAEVELWIENDKLVLNRTSIVFVPAGAAHGRIEVKNVKKPVFHYTCHLNTDTYEELPAQATAPKGTYAGSWVEKYAPVDGRLPSAPEGFLTRLLWIDSKKLPGAPYMEAVWFKTKNDTGPEAHTHDFDEFIGFIGTDPEHPEELGAEVQFYIGDEYFSMTKSCLVYIPRGVRHSPILVPKLERPIIHFSGGNGGDYKRDGSEQF